MSARLLLTTMVLSTTMPALVQAQTLADVARAEAERRTRVTPGKRYTDADLHYVPPPPAETTPPAPAAPSDKTPDGSAPATEPAVPPVAGREKRDEAYWRARSSELLARVQDGRERVHDAEARLTELDAGPQSPMLARERQVTAAAALRHRRDLQFGLDELQRFEQRARTHSIADGWLR